jgi:hypothetical protein
LNPFPNTKKIRKFECKHHLSSVANHPVPLPEAFSEKNSLHMTFFKLKESVKGDL